MTRFTPILFKVPKTTARKTSKPSPKLYLDKPSGMMLPKKGLLLIRAMRKR
jgi:hypothetical protein